MDETSTRKQLNEGNAPLRPQMLSPNTAAYIQALGVGHYLQMDTVTFEFKPGST